MSLSRRQWLSGGAAWLTAQTARPTGAATSRTAPLLAPRLSDDLIVGTVAGIRPYRRGGPRIQRQDVAGKIIVHNYGHGGAGHTLSWGSAVEAADLLRDLPPRRTGVVVLGAGVVGLTTALVLQERGFRVRVCARDFPPHTTSDVAGAEWSPDIVERGATATEQLRFDRMLVHSWRRFNALVGRGWGITPRPIYEADGVRTGLDELPPTLKRRGRPLASFPFAPGRSGRVYQTLLIEAPLFMARLADEVRRNGCTFTTQSFAHPDQLASLPEPVVINGTGLGAATLFADDALVPIRGQLVHLKRQPLPYLVDHASGYLVPRSDVLVVGGSFEEGRAEARTDPATCARILADARRFFGPG